MARSITYVALPTKSETVTVITKMTEQHERRKRKWLRQWDAWKQDYCGPGPFTIKTNKYVNAACKAHDEAYADIGPSAYFIYNEADEAFLNRLKYLKRHNQIDRGGNLAIKIFETKKNIMPVSNDVYEIDLGRPAEFFTNVENLGRYKRAVDPAWVEEDEWERKHPGERDPVIKWTRGVPFAGVTRYGKYAGIGHYENKRIFGTSMARKRSSKKVFKRRPYKRRRYSRKRTYSKRSLNYLPPQTVKRHDFYGLASGLVADKGNPVINRTSVWGRNEHLAVENLRTAFSYINGLSAISAGQKIAMTKYWEKHTISNSSLYPTTITVYKVTARADIPRTTATASPLTLATEQSQFNISYNSNFLVGDADMGLVAFAHANMQQSLPTGVSLDANRSYMDATTLGTSLNVARFNRPYGCMVYKNLGRDFKQKFKIKKVKQKVLPAGGQFSIFFKGRGRYLTSDVMGSNKTGLLKGATMFLFSAQGMLCRDSTLTSTTVDSVAKAPHSIMAEFSCLYQFKLIEGTAQVREQNVTGWYIGDPIAAARRPQSDHELE